MMMGMGGGGMGDMMMGGMGGDMMMGGGWKALLGWVLLAALVVVGLIILFRLLRRGANPRGATGLTSETPLAALQRRFALGEINATQFGAMKQQLANP